MEISGTVFVVLESKSGSSAKGPWIQHSFVIETQGEYPKKVMFTMFSKDATSRLSIREGDNVTVSFNVESREWNGKWFSDIKAYKITTEGQRASQDKPVAKKGSPASADPNEDLFATPTGGQQQSSAVDNSTDDLPFG